MMRLGTHQVCRSALLTSAILLTACGTSGGVPPTSTSATDTASQPAASKPGAVTASAVVIPTLRSEMSFVIAAPIREVLVEKGDKAESGQVLMVLESPDLEFAVAGAEAALRAAQVEAELQRYSHKELNAAGKAIYVTGPPEVRQVADARVAQAQAALEVAQGQLAEATLRAPYDGTVVEIKTIRGEFAEPGQVVLTFGDLDHLIVETTDLSERDVTRVRVGQSATVYIEALDEELMGTVTSIAPLAESLGGDVVYRVTLALSAQPVDLLWGMSAEIVIIEN